MEFNTDLVLANAIRLIYMYGSTTTLDVKNEIRERFSFQLTQNTVSDAMSVLESVGFFEYTDNGTYRTYYLNKAFLDNTKPNNNINKEQDISKADAVKFISGLKADDNIIINFIKKDSSLRTINAKIHSPNTGLGSLLVYDLDIADGTNNIRTVDLRKLTGFEVDGISYKVVKNTK